MRVIITAYVRFPNALAWHALQLAKALRDGGNEVFLFAQKDSPFSLWVKNEGFLNNCELNLNRFSPIEIAKGIVALKRVIDDFAPDILNPHCPPGHTFLALTRKLAHKKIPLIRTVAEPRAPQSNIINKFLHEKVTDGIIFTTQSSVTRYLNQFDLRDKLHEVIYPGIDAKLFSDFSNSENFRVKYGISADTLVMGVIARMAPEKGQEVLFEAISLLDDSYRKKIKVVIAGEDSPKRTKFDLENIAKQFNTENSVIFTGKLNDVRSLMQTLDIGIITSTSSEAICRVALEYMSFGIPIIASDINILPEVVKNNFNGLIYRNRDASALAGCIKLMIDDKSKRDFLGHNGLNLVKSAFSTATQLDRTMTFYQRTLTQRAS